MSLPAPRLCAALLLWVLSSLALPCAADDGDSGPCPPLEPRPADAEVLAAAGVAAAQQRPMLYRLLPPDPAIAPSWLFGTVHLGPPWLRDLAPSVALALRRSRALVVEALGDEAEVAAWSQRSVAIKDGDSAAAALSPVLVSRFLQIARRRGVDPGNARRLRPWAAAMLVGRPPNSAHSLDAELRRQARDAGLALRGLQRLGDIAADLDALPAPVQRALLADAICQYDRLGAVYAQLARVYASGDPAAVRQLNRWSREGDAVARVIHEQMVVARNRVFLERALAWLDDGAQFVAVGADHLAGEAGLIAALRAAGWGVHPID